MHCRFLNFRPAVFRLLVLLSAGALPGAAAALDVAWNQPHEAPVSADSYDAAGQVLNMTLNTAATDGTDLTVINNTGLDFIAGEFGNARQGATVVLHYQGAPREYVVNYFGGTGNDLVLHWKRRTVVSWGSNAFGQLGATVEVSRNVPGLVNTEPSSALAGKTVIRVAAGRNHSLALCADGTVVAWGGNENGKLGDGSTTNRPVPVAVNTQQGVSALHGKRVIAISAGMWHSMALCSDGTVAAWGFNGMGQLGDNTTVDRFVPVAVNQSPGFSFLAGKKVVGIAAGNRFSFAVTSTGEVASWGMNSAGQLGDLTTLDRKLPAPVSAAPGFSALAGRKVAAVSGGDDSSVALCTDGRLVWWGGGTAPPRPVLADDSTSAVYGRTAEGIASGHYHHLALCSDGVVAAWGAGHYGQLGDGSFTHRYPPVEVFAGAGGVLHGKRIVSVAGGETHSVALCADGTMAAWGSNQAGELGTGTVSDSMFAASVTMRPEMSLASGRRAVSVVAGFLYNLAIITDPVPLPAITVEQPEGTGLEDAVSTVDFGNALPGTAALAARTFLVRNPGGADLSGLAVSVTGEQAGDFTVHGPAGTTVASGAATTFTVVFTPAAAGSRRAALHISSNVPGAANPFDVELTGTGNTGPAVTVVWNGTDDPAVTEPAFSAEGKIVNLALNYPPPAGATLRVVTITGPAPIAGAFSNLAHGQRISLACGGVFYHFVANYFGGTGNDLELWWADNRVAGWGNNTMGQLGTGQTGENRIPTAADYSPSSALYGGTVLAVAAGETHGLALLSDGRLAAWGQNGNGEVGDGTKNPRTVPVRVLASGASALAGRTAISVAAGHLCSAAVCSDGRVVTWGSNMAGLLGIGTQAAHVETPVPTLVASGAGSALAGKSAVSVAASTHMLALCSDGTIAAWGSGERGQLGDGAGMSSGVPVVVNALPGSALHGKTVIAVAAGAGRSFALCSDGTLAAWGANETGALGDGTRQDRNIPVAVDILSGSALAEKTVVAISSATGHAVALCSDGTVSTWGANNSGQLGNALIEPFESVAIPSEIVTDSRTALHGKTVTGISAGGSFTSVWTADGAAAGWGRNWQGQAGGPQHESGLPVAVDSTPGVSALAGRRVLQVAASPAGFSGFSLAIVAIPPPDSSGPAGGTMTLSPPAPEEPFTPVTVTFAGWQDSAAPLSYQLLLDGAELAPRTFQPVHVLTAPAAPGVHTLTGRIYDSLNHVTEISRSFVVMPAYASLGDWRLGWFESIGNLGIAADRADPDGDGLPNLVEWGCRLNPRAPDSPPYAVSREEGHLVFTWRRAMTAVNAGAVFTVEWSDGVESGSTWQTGGISTDVTAEDGKLQHLRTVIPAGTSGRRFVRLRVTR